MPRVEPVTRAVLLRREYSAGMGRGGVWEGSGVEVIFENGGMIALATRREGVCLSYS